VIDGGGTDDSMVDLSEDVPEVLQEKSTASGPGSVGESRLAETFLSASSKHPSEVEVAKTQVSTANVCCVCRKTLCSCFLFSAVDPILTQRHYYEPYSEVSELIALSKNGK
jgi:hypothetical protein